MNMDNCITLQNVSVGYGGISILKDINLTIKTGEYVVLLGSNASGKTTLFKTILHPKMGEQDILDPK
jgi:ABC-type cobalamin/Fe3+-siderophores transport system ATPase subunit